MSTWTVAEVPADPTRADRIGAVVDVRTAVALDTWGTPDVAEPLASELARLRDQSFTRRGYLAAVEDDRTVGAAFFQLPEQDNTSTAWIDVQVLPEARGRGIGSALHDAALEWLRAHGRTVIQASTDQCDEPPAGPGTLAPPTGAGLVLADAPGVRFLRHRGWALEQVSRRSVLTLPVPGLDQLSATAEAAAGPDYRLVAWEETPDEWLDQYAYVVGRMSTDVPLGGLDWGQQVWNTARIRSSEERARRAGRRLLVAAAEHVPTRTLAAFTTLDVSAGGEEECAHQGDTLVVPDHRGRRLGMLVKAANLRRLVDQMPTVHRVDTWNAEENGWMLAINTALGFRPAGGAGEWQVTL